MDIVFNFGDDEEKMQPGEKISFGKLDIIADQLGILHLQEPETLEQKEEQSPPVYAYAVGMEEAVDVGSLALAHHLTLHTYVFAEAGREHELDISF